MPDVDTDRLVKGHHEADVLVKVEHMLVISKVGLAQARVIFGDDKVIALKVLDVVVEV